MVPVLAALLFCAGWASSQSAQAPGFKYYVWGQIRSPGTYSLGANPDVLELLSAAGGPTADADVRHVVLIRAATRTQTKIDLKKMLLAAQVIPLSPGDVIIVPNSPWFSFRYGIGVVSTVVSFVTLALVIMTWVGK